MTNAVGYTRLSQDSDTSIDRQKRHIREYADQHDFELEHIYNDGEYSSGFETDTREDYQELRGRIREGDLDAVLVNDKRRLARDVDEVMRLIPDLRTENIELHTYEDGLLDLSDPLKAAIEILQAAAAHEEKLKEIRRAIESVEERLDAGYDHGPERFGMEYRDDGKYQKPSDDFETVEKIWELRDDGVGFEEIEERTGVPSSTVHRIVENRDWYMERKRMHEQEADA